MDNQPVRFGAFFVGGLFISVWLYVAFFGYPGGGRPNLVMWNVYGLLGILVATGVFAARAATVYWRIGIITGLGVIVGFLLLAGFAGEYAEMFAAAFTLAGGALIVSALPTPQSPTVWTQGTAVNQTRDPQ